MNLTAGDKDKLRAAGRGAGTENGSCDCFFAREGESEHAFVRVERSLYAVCRQVLADYVTLQQLGRRTAMELAKRAAHPPAHFNSGARKKNVTVSHFSVYTTCCYMYNESYTRAYHVPARGPFTRTCRWTA